MLYDGLAERSKRRREDNVLLLNERKEAFDRFLDVNHRNMKYRDQLHDLGIIAGRGETPPEGTLESFPDSPMGELVTSLDEVRRIARSYSVIQAAEAIVQIYADMTAAEKHALDQPSDPNNEITWFLLRRFSEDREREFVHAYRAELGLGRPAGAPASFMSARQPNPAKAELILRHHLAYRRQISKSPRPEPDVNPSDDSMPSETQ